MGRRDSPVAYMIFSWITVGIWEESVTGGSSSATAVPTGSGGPGESSQIASLSSRIYIVRKLAPGDL